MNLGAHEISDNLKVGCLNCRSICNKTVDVLELLRDNDIDLCCLTETWLRVDDKAKFAEIREFGYDIFSCPRKGRGGGLAFVFNPFKVKPVEHKVSNYSSFEVFECLVRTADPQKTVRLCVVYRSTQKGKYEDTKVTTFFEQFDSYLDSLNDKSGVPVICGDFNFKVNILSDKNAQAFLKLCNSKGFSQHIKKPTHVDGNTLDLVLTSSSVSSNIPIKDINVDNKRCVSDHFLLTFDLPVTLSTKNLKKKSEKVT